MSRPKVLTYFNDLRWQARQRKAKWLFVLLVRQGWFKPSEKLLESCGTIVDIFDTLRAADITEPQEFEEIYNGK